MIGFVASKEYADGNETNYTYDDDGRVLTRTWERLDNSTAVKTTYTYDDAGTYYVSVFGDFPRIYFNNGGDKTKIQTIQY